MTNERRKKIRRGRRKKDKNKFIKWFQGLSKKKKIALILVAVVLLLILIVVAVVDVDVILIQNNKKFHAGVGCAGSCFCAFNTYYAGAIILRKTKN